MEKAKSQHVPQPVPERDDVHLVANRCPFCRDDVAAKDDTTLVCQRCLARHHAPCWSEAASGGRCSACGATERLALVKPPSIAARSARALLLVLAGFGLLAAVLTFGLYLFLTGDEAAVVVQRPAQHYVQAQAQSPRAFAVPNGLTLLVSDGTATGAVVFETQSTLEERATFRWYLRDGPGTLDPSDPAVRTGVGETVRDPGEARGLRVRFGPFDLEWSAGGPGQGWIYASSTARLRLVEEAPAQVDPTTRTYLDDAGREHPAR